MTPHSGNAARPRQVTTAVWLLALFPVLIVVTVVVTFLALDAATSNADRLVSELTGRQVVGPEAVVGSLLSRMRAQIYTGTFIKVVQAIVLGALAVFVRRGSPGARIGVFIVAGLTTLGAVGLVVLTGLRNTLYDALERRASGIGAGAVLVNESDLLPGWYDWFNYGMVTLSVGLAGAVVWLLTRPAASAYFGRGRPPRHPFPQAPFGAPAQYPPYQQHYQQPPYQQPPPYQQHPPYQQYPPGSPPGQQPPYGPPQNPGAAP